MRFYYHNKQCEYCQAEFEASRDDARFCSSKCRTANSRRQKRRQQAATSMTAVWDKYTQNAYAHLTDEHPASANRIKDIYINHSPQAAADATIVAYEVMSTFSRIMENQVRHKQETIDSLREDQNLLHHIKTLVNR